MKDFQQSMRIKTQRTNEIIKKITQFAEKETRFDLNTNWGDVIAHILSINDDLSSFYLETGIDKYVDRIIGLAIPTIDEIYEKLVKGKAVRDNPYIYNDLDCSLFYLPSGDDRRIFVTTSQNFNFIFIRSSLIGMKDEKLKVFRFYDQMDRVDTYEIDQIEKFGPIDWALIHANHFNQCYSDCAAPTHSGPVSESDYKLLVGEEPNDGRYIDRPDLDYFLKRSFRKIGDNYSRIFERPLIKYTSFMPSLDSGYTFSYPTIKQIFTEIEFGHQSLMEENDD